MPQKGGCPTVSVIHCLRLSMTPSVPAVGGSPQVLFALTAAGGPRALGQTGMRVPVLEGSRAQAHNTGPRGLPAAAPP